MKREILIETLRKAAEEIAKELGFNNRKETENDCGIWGEHMTEYLEKKVGGDCKKQVLYTKTDKKADGYVEMRFRFASPCLCIRMAKSFEMLSTETCELVRFKDDCLYEVEFSNQFSIDSGEEGEPLQTLPEVWKTSATIWGDVADLRAIMNKHLPAEILAFIKH